MNLLASDCLQPIHEAQVLPYLKLAGVKIGLLLNFNVPILRENQAFNYMRSKQRLFQPTSTCPVKWVPACF